MYIRKSKRGHCDNSVAKFQHNNFSPPSPKTQGQVSAHAFMPIYSCVVVWGKINNICCLTLHVAFKIKWCVQWILTIDVSQKLIDSNKTMELGENSRLTETHRMHYIQDWRKETKADQSNISEDIQSLGVVHKKRLQKSTCFPALPLSTFVSKWLPLPLRTSSSSIRDCSMV